MRERGRGEREERHTLAQHPVQRQQARQVRRGCCYCCWHSGSSRQRQGRPCWDRRMPGGEKRERERRADREGRRSPSRGRRRAVGGRGTRRLPPRSGGFEHAGQRRTSRGLRSRRSTSRLLPTSSHVRAWFRSGGRGLGGGGETLNPKSVGGYPRVLPVGCGFPSLATEKWHSI